MIDARLPDPLEPLRRAAEKNGRPAEQKDRGLDGARFILDAPERVPAVWGAEDTVVQA